MKKAIVASLIVMMGLLTVNCPEKKDDNNAALLALLLLSSQGRSGQDLCDGVGVPRPTQILEGTITTPITVSGSAILRGTVFVRGGGSITVNPGSVVFGESGSSLFVSEGGSLTAEGSQNNPICFTSANEVGKRAPADWGGIVVIGNSSNVTRTGANTEGTTPQTYPGTQNATVRLKYVVIEFVGNEVAPGNELNGLSMYAVTNSSDISYVQIHRGLDDGFEWWGGNTPGKYLMVTAGLDDDFDMDEGFSGNLQFLISAKYPNNCGGTVSTDPHGFEMDGFDGNGTSAGSGTDTATAPTVSNFTTIGRNITAGEGMRFREGMRGNFTNGLVYGYITRNFNCINNPGTTGTTNPTVAASVHGQTGKTNAIGSECAAFAASNDLSAVPIVSEGNIAECGAGTNKPDFTSIAGYETKGGGPTAEGKWWNGWTVYRSN